jgi:hypothetical protein
MNFIAHDEGIDFIFSALILDILVDIQPLGGWLIPEKASSTDQPHLPVLLS